CAPRTGARKSRARQPRRRTWRRWAYALPRADDGNVEEGAGMEAARILDRVFIGNAPPLFGALPFLGRDGRKRLAAAHGVTARAVGRFQIQLPELLVERAVLAQDHVDGRAQRNAFGREQRELLADALDDALEAVAILVAEPHVEGISGEVMVPDE